MDRETKTPPAGDGEGARSERWGGGSQRHNMSPGVGAQLDLVLSRLVRVRKAGAGFTAQCPAHEDRTASLSIAAGDDGRLLLHCFAGCGVHAVVAAIGLTIVDLFPRRLADVSPAARGELQGRALRAQVQACAAVLDHESGVVLIAAGDVHQGQVLTDADRQRLVLAAERIRAARVAIGGSR